jgi:ribosomal protein S18 acetylase RimI-like enzyme
MLVEIKANTQKMFSRKMHPWELNKIRKLLINNLRMTSKDIALIMIHYIANIPLKLLNTNTIVGSVAQLDKENIGGLIIARRLPKAKIWIIGPLVVNKNCRSQGIGTSLLRFTLKMLKENKAKGVLVSIDNTDHHSAARKLFRKFGFKVLVTVYTTAKQAYEYSRIISQGQPVVKIKQQHKKTKNNIKKSKLRYYIFFKNLKKQQ